MVDRITEKIKVRKVGNESFYARLVYTEKNRLKRIEIARKDEDKGGEMLLIKDKEELANLRAILFKSSCVLARRIPTDYVEVGE